MVSKLFWSFCYYACANEVELNMGEKVLPKIKGLEGLPIEIW